MQAVSIRSRSLPEPSAQHVDQIRVQADRSAATPTREEVGEVAGGVPRVGGIEEDPAYELGIVHGHLRVG